VTRGEELERLGTALTEAEKDGTEPPSVIAAIRLLILTGCRPQEILGLRWEQVDFERQLLCFEKSRFRSSGSCSATPKRQRRNAMRTLRPIPEPT